MVINLPKPIKGALNVSDLTMAIFSDAFTVFGIPGAAFFETIKIYKENKIKEATEILIKEIEGGNVDIRSEDYEEYIPIAFRFFKAASDGESINLLRLFSRIISGQIAVNKVEAFSFNRAVTALAGLNDNDLKLLSIYVKCTHSVVGMGYGSVQDKVQTEAVDGDLFNDQSLAASASMLSGRGLLIPLSLAIPSGGLIKYFASPLAFEIADLAKTII